MYQKLIYGIILLALAQTSAYAHGDMGAAALGAGYVYLFLLAAISVSSLCLTLALISLYYTKKWLKVVGIVFTIITMVLGGFFVYAFIEWESNIFMLIPLVTALLSMMMLLYKKKPA